MQRLRRLPVERDPQIHAAVVAEASNRIAGLRVDGREVAAGNEQQPAIRAIGTLPIVHPARAASFPASALRQISLPVAASTAASVLPDACRYITPSTTSGLRMTVPVTGNVQTTWSCDTFDVLI